LEVVEKMRDSLKPEIENLLAQCQEDVAQLEDQLRNAKTQCNQFIWETRVLITREQLIDDDLEAVEKMTDFLNAELENFRAQYQEDVTQLEDMLRNVITQCNQFICERRLLITRAQLIDEDLEAVEKMRDSLKLELENLRPQYQEEDHLRNVGTQCNQFICERCVLVTRAHLIDEDLEAVDKVRDSLKPEIENLRVPYQKDVSQLEDQLPNVRTQCNQFICDRRALISRAQLIDEDLEAVKKIRGSLKPELNNLRAQYQEDVAQFRK
jgi:chromosome segregation ATPase